MNHLTGTEIRDARYMRKMTLRALAREVGVSAPYMCDVEHGRRALSAENTAKVAEILKIKPHMPVRGCVGHGGTFDAAITSALWELRHHGHFWSSFKVQYHTIEMYLGADGTWAQRHRVVLEITRGAKKT